MRLKNKILIEVERALAIALLKNSPVKEIQSFSFPVTVSVVSMATYKK
jgi:hypothetical protein